jgi:hypothetical protein
LIWQAHEAERGERRRLDDGHVVRGLQRGAGDHRAGAPAEVRRAGGRAGAHRAEHAVPVQAVEQVEGVAAAHGDRLGVADRGGRVGGGVHAAHGDA